MDSAWVFERPSTHPQTARTHTHTLSRTDRDGSATTSPQMCATLNLHSDIAKALIWIFVCVCVCVYLSVCIQEQRKLNSGMLRLLSVEAAKRRCAAYLRRVGFCDPRSPPQPLHGSRRVNQSVWKVGCLFTPFVLADLYLRARLFSSSGLVQF